MGKFKYGTALVVGDSSPKISEVVNILSKHFRIVQRAGGLTEGADAYPSGHFDLVVVTDSMKAPADGDFISDLKRKFYQAKVLALFNDISQGVEIRMRSLGLIFLGSYQHFSENSLNIFRSAFKPGTGKQED